VFDDGGPGRSDREHFDYYCWLIGVRAGRVREDYWRRVKRLRGGRVVTGDPAEYE
jgi:hypothetical protein